MHTVSFTSTERLKIHPPRIHPRKLEQATHVAGNSKKHTDREEICSSQTGKILALFGVFFTFPFRACFFLRQFSSYWQTSRRYHNPTRQHPPDFSQSAQSCTQNNSRKSSFLMPEPSTGQKETPDNTPPSRLSRSLARTSRKAHFNF